MTPAQAQGILVRFCNGASVADVAQWEALKRDSVERILRQALRQLIHRQREGDPQPVMN